MKDYKANLKINEFDLNREILEQPQKFYDYSYLAAQAKNERDDAKDDLDIIKTEIEARIRQKKDKYPTEGAIKSAVDNHRKVKKQRLKWIEARRKYNLLEKAEKAFEQRRRMIETYVYYNVHNMNSNVRIPRQQQREIDSEISSDIKDQLRSSIKRRKRK